MDYFLLCCANLLGLCRTGILLGRTDTKTLAGVAGGVLSYLLWMLSAEGDCGQRGAMLVTGESFGSAHILAAAINTAAFVGEAYLMIPESEVTRAVGG